MRLPEALTPWRETLSLFPPELALTLGEGVLRLSAFLPTAATRFEPGHGEPDGFAGLSRRGPYDRLVPSEWLLRDEVPDEFLRRAATGEHLFYDLARVESIAGRRFTVLFDSGPDQIGGPKLGQLAALVLFTERARAAGAELVWGHLQDPERAAHGTPRPETLAGLLKAYSEERPESRHLEAWRETLPTPREADDLWLVGSGRLLPLSDGPVSVLAFEDPLERAPEDTLAVTLATRGNRRRGRLKLPPPELGVRLLRDPFRDEATPPRRVLQPVTADRGAFSYTGRRLILRRPDASLLALHVPEFPTQELGQPITLALPPGENLVAVGLHRRSLMAATLDGHMLSFHGGAQALRRAPRSIGLPPHLLPTPAGEGGSRSLPLLWNLSPRAPHAAMMIDGAGRVYRIGLTNSEVPVEVAFEWALGAYPYPVSHAVDLPVLRAHDGESHLGHHLLRVDQMGLVDDVRPLPPFRHRPNERSVGGFKAVGIQSHDGAWVIFGVGQHWTLTPGPEGTVVGVTSTVGRQDTPGLLVLHDRTLEVVSRRFRETLFKTDSDILWATAGGASPLVAYGLEDGRVRVFNLTRKDLLLEWSPDGGSW